MTLDHLLFCQNKLRVIRTEQDVSRFHQSLINDFHVHKIVDVANLESVSHCWYVWSNTKGKG